MSIYIGHTWTTIQNMKIEVMYNIYNDPVKKAIYVDVIGSRTALERSSLQYAMETVVPYEQIQTEMTLYMSDKKNSIAYNVVSAGEKCGFCEEKAAIVGISTYTGTNAPQEAEKQHLREGTVPVCSGCIDCIAIYESSGMIYQMSLKEFALACRENPEVLNEAKSAQTL